MKKDESWMATRVANFLKRSSTRCDFAEPKFRFQNVEFDVIGYESDSNTFHIVECKKSAKAAGIGHAFGQLLAYKSVLHQTGYQFLEEFLKRARFNLALEDIVGPVTEGKLRAKFYVGLVEEACKNVELLRLIKESLQNVGIIRVKESGICRDYIRIGGEKDYELCQSKLANIPIRRIYTHAQFLRAVEWKLRDRLSGTPLTDFRTMRVVDKPFGDFYLFWFSRRSFHFEATLRKRKYIELALHLEDGEEDNLSLYNYFKEKRKNICRNLGEQARLARWGKKHGRRIYEQWPRTELTEELAERAAQKLADYIGVLQPMIEDWEKTRSSS